MLHSGERALQDHSLDHEIARPPSGGGPYLSWPTIWNSVSQLHHTLHVSDIRNGAHWNALRVCPIRVYLPEIQELPPSAHAEGIL